MDHPGQKIPRWMTVTLWLAGVYNLSWGTAAMAFPAWSFAHSGMERPGEPLGYPQLWQCIGMIVGVYGVGYLIAARDPFRHWPIVLVGLLGKMLGPVGAVDAAWRGELPWASLLWTNVTNDFVWWVPFGLILWGAWRSRDTSEARAVE